MLLNSCKYSYNQQEIENKIKDYRFFSKTLKIKTIGIQKHLLKLSRNIDKRKKDQLYYF
jgi:hypothetical protein